MRTALVLSAVRLETAAEQDDFTMSELRLAAQLHQQIGERLSAAQYTDMANRKEAAGGEGTREYPD